MEVMQSPSSMTISAAELSAGVVEGMTASMSNFCARPQFSKPGADAEALILLP
jgi:hypothetical protein